MIQNNKPHDQCQIFIVSCAPCLYFRLLSSILRKDQYYDLFVQGHMFLNLEKTTIYCKEFYVELTTQNNKLIYRKEKTIGNCISFDAKLAPNY